MILNIFKKEVYLDAPAAGPPPSVLACGLPESDTGSALQNFEMQESADGFNSIG